MGHAAYDSDAIASLIDGQQPACHKMVGNEAIFAHGHDDPSDPCMGWVLRYEPDDRRTWPKEVPAIG